MLMYDCNFADMIKMESTMKFPAGRRLLASVLPLLALLSACGGLSDREEKMVLSDTRPLMELNADRTSVLRAIRPGDISYSVSGVWKVEGDSLIIESDSTSITIEEGDPGLVGHIACRVAYPITGFNESTLSIQRQGITYDYHRRMD